MNFNDIVAENKVVRYNFMTIIMSSFLDHWSNNCNNPCSICVQEYHDFQ